MIRVEDAMRRDHSKKISLLVEADVASLAHTLANLVLVFTCVTFAHNSPVFLVQRSAKDMSASGSKNHAQKLAFISKDLLLGSRKRFL